MNTRDLGSRDLVTFPAPKVDRKAEKAAALAELRALCPPGTTVYTILRSVSRSGMSRSITPLVIDTRGDIHNLTWLVARVLGRSIKRAFQDGIKCDGCGSDMGHDLVNSLSYALHGYNLDALKQGTTPNAHPGYTLNHRWL